MPSIPNHRRAWTLLVFILFHLSYPVTCQGRMAGPAGADTIVQGNKEWGKFRKCIRRKERHLKDTTRRRILAAVLGNLDNLENSIQKYAIRHVDAGSGETTYAIDADVIIFNIQRKNAANFIHETTHGGQYQRGEIVYRDTVPPGWKDTCGGLGDDFDDEIEAYKAQFAYDPASVTYLPNQLNLRPRRLTQITKVWLLNLEDTNHLPPLRIYLPNLKDGITERHINIYSTKGDLVAAYPKADFGKFSKDYVLGKDPNYLNFPAKLRRYQLTRQTGYGHPTTTSSLPRSR